MTVGSLPRNAVPAQEYQTQKTAVARWFICAER